jgi:hypothetical protein
MVPKEESATSEEPELAPYKIEAARSSRSKCRTCRRKIDKDKLRLGILLEGPYGTGYLWHHLTCAARRRIEDVEAAYAENAHEGLQAPSLSELQALQEKAAKVRSARKEPPYAERAPSDRSKCKNCGEAIAKSALRIVLAREISFGNQVRSTPINVHAGCVAAELQAEDCTTEVDGFEESLRQNSELEPSAVDEALAAIGELG